MLLLMLEAAIDGHCHARGAETALGAMKRRETLLDSMETFSLVSQALGRSDGAAVDRAEQHQAGVHGVLLHFFGFGVVFGKYNQTCSAAT